MEKILKDYSKFKLTHDDVLRRLRVECITEMYAKAQPSIDYQKILEYYQKCKDNNQKPERIFDRHYLSQEEYTYIINKYLEAYNLKEQFRSNCDIIIRDMKDGCIKDLYVPEMLDKKGIVHSGSSEYEKVSPLSKIIGGRDAKRVIKFITERRDFYRFDRAEEEFRIMVSMGDSPCSNAQTVIDYWKTQGVNLEIDPRHYSQDDFWSEENGYFDEED